MSLSLSSILHVSVSTYENPSMDTVYEQMRYDLDECKDSDDTIEVQGLGRVKYDDVDCDDGLDWDKCKKDIGEGLQKAIEYDVSCVHNRTLSDVFAKYGLEYTGMSFYTPKCYNYEGDSLDISLKTMWDTYNLTEMGLIPYIEEYIEKVRTPSYDGYCSFEPTIIDEVDIDDYCTLWAILKKEGVYDCMREAIEGWMMDDLNEVVWANANPKYEVKVPNGKKKMRNDGDYANPIRNEYDDWDRKNFHLDYDTKTLIPMDK